MGILSVSVKVGEGVQIGDAAFIRVDDKNGRSVSLKIATRDPAQRVQRVPTGIIPDLFLVPTGIPAARPAAVPA